ncbi:MAG: LAGLIDADG family homing endonuclease, partial [Xenococcaceae cyanobacterium]
RYVTQKYGESNVAQIITFNRMTSKAVLKDVARVLGISYADSDRMAKLIPVKRGKPAKLKVMISDDTPDQEFKKAYEQDSVKIYNDRKEPVGEISVRRWLDMAIRIEGTNKTFGVHAAGVVISSQPLDEVVPLQKNNDGAVITQYYMEDIEALGLLKMDFLGLKNLTTIQKAANLIKHNRNIEINLDQLPLDERKALEIIAKGSIKKLPDDIKNTHKLLGSGDLEGIFQLESDGMKQMARDLQPSGIEDISSISALYRPGPLDAGLIPIFIDRKHGKEKVKYQHPLLEPILKETYGVLCLPKGTPINQPDGQQIPIENIKAGDLILTSNGQKVWSAKVAKQWQSGVKEIIKITLSSGTVIYSSKNHRFLTSEGDKFACELKPASNGLKNAHIHSSVLYEQWPLSTNKQKLQPNEAYLLGLLIGDGNLVSSTPNIACATEETAIWVSKLMSDTWRGEPKHYFNTRCWYAYCKFNTAPNLTPLTKFLDRFYGGRNWKVKSIFKHLPQQIAEFCEADRIDLLRGLWDSDGCYSERIAYFRSSSPQLIKQVAWLLSSLKIWYFVAENYVYVADRTQFRVILGKSRLPNKNDRLVGNYLPIGSQAFAETLAESIVATDRHTRKIINRSLGRSILFRPKESLYKNNLANWDEFYNQLYQKTYLQDARPVYVVSIEEQGTAECFDLEMEDRSSPYFLANGIVTHNCYQEQIMKMAQDLAGYSLGQADLLRRAMGKKKAEEMQKQREIFIDGATKNGVTKNIAEELFDQMVLFAEYCLSYDTEILTEEYGALAIGEIVKKKLSCLVYTRHESGIIYVQRIEQWHDRGEQEIFEYTLENGSTIKATKDHKFMTSDGQMLPIDEIFERGLDLMEQNSYIVDNYNFKPIIPDYYSCPWYHGNHCSLKIVKLDFHYLIEHQGCTERFVFYGDERDALESKKNYEIGLSNWMLSDDLYYENYSEFVNECINGYRNITYVKQQQLIDNSFTLEKAKTPEHTFIALNNAIKPSLQLYKSLQDSNKFNEDQLLSFRRYLRFRYFDNCFREIFAQETEHLAAQKEIFDYIIANPSNINGIVTNEMIEEFQQQYKIYQEDSKKYGHETVEERRERLNQERIEKGLKPVIFP